MNYNEIINTFLTYALGISLISLIAMAFYGMFFKKKLEPWKVHAEEEKRAALEAEAREKVKAQLAMKKKHEELARRKEAKILEMKKAEAAEAKKRSELKRERKHTIESRSTEAVYSASPKKVRMRVVKSNPDSSRHAIAFS